MRFDVISLFPEMFLALRASGLVGQALEQGRVQMHLHNPRTFALSRHGAVDDRPYGGGDGMIMSALPLTQCLSAVQEQAHIARFTVLLSPTGQKLDVGVCEKLSSLPQLTLVCGRYGGVDQRFVTRYVDLEISIGDYILNGGELAAMVLIDALTRLLPGVLGNEVSAREESFFGGLLECPQFTRPQIFESLTVPEILLSGHHDEIKKWRRLLAILYTRERRPDLLQNAQTSAMVTAHEIMMADALLAGMSDEQKRTCGLQLD